MIAALKPYPKYKDSGVPWLGDVPEHWGIKRAKDLFQSVDVRSETGEEELLTVSSNHGVVPRRSVSVTMFKAESYVGHKLCWPGDLVINSLWAWARGLGVSSFRGIVSSAYGVYRARRECEISSRFIHELVRSTPFSWELRVRSKGVWTSRLQLTDESFLGSPIPLPPPTEQTAIVRFLDYYDRKIMHYIRAKQKLIKLLEEQKQAIIHRAVTRGLDPNVRLKPSGVEWLGDVPEHWKILSNGRLFWERKEWGDPGWPTLIVSLRTGVTIGSEEDERGRPRRLIENRTNYRKAVKGDLAYNMMRMWQGAVGVAPVDGLVSPAYVVAAPRDEVDAAFFSLLFRTEAYKGGINRVSTGIVSDRNRLYWDDFKRLPSSVPPLPEQRQISEAVETECKKIDAASAGQRREIALLREYRTRLISDVVTGKLDVREVAVGLPDEAEELVPVDERDALIDEDEDTADELVATPEKADA